MVELLNFTKLEEVAAILKGIRTRRNDFIHNKLFKHPTLVCSLAIAEMIAYKEALKKERADIIEIPVGIHTWTKPDENRYKVNWDVAVKATEGKIGVAVIIRDHVGQVMGTLRANRPLMGTSFDAEACGLLLATSFCKDMGMQKICLKRDSKQAVDLLQSGVFNWSLGGCLIGEAQQILETVTNWTASHVYREANMAAHQLAKEALACVEDLYGIEEFLSCILPIVTKEMM